ncbi:MAG: Gfo/Idh/MocA family oxidoreductase [Planctomycetes bacterium]|nr:Gfo/Idh/MocA family oxidoreductase [Planctomycetota bacterium]
MRQFITRRGLFKMAGAGMATPLVIRAAALGADGRPAPSDRVNVGCIGVGGRGTDNLKTLLHASQVVAVCDPQESRRDAARSMAEQHYSELMAKGTYKGCAAYNDFRELLDRGDVDAVSVCTPDHWHAVICIAAAKAGKDVFCEKPLSLTIAEGRAICDAMRRYGRVFQHGTQRRSEGNFAFACELVRNGRIGELKRVRVSSEPSHPAPNEPPAPVPQGFDYDLWLGPAPFVPYSPRRVRTPHWYWIADYTIGFISGQGVHFTDVAQWGMGTDDTGPVEIEGHGVIPKDGMADTAVEWHVEMTFANGLKFIYDDHRAFPMGVIFEGTEGKVNALCNGISAEPKSLMTSVIKPHEVRLRRPRGHVPDFVHCVRTRERTAAPAEAAHRATGLCHLAHIAVLTGGRKLRWDPAAERFLGDADANAHLSKALRAPWRL